MDLSYILNQLGEERENYFNAVSAPLIQSSNFAFNTVEDYQKAMQDEQAANIYSRAINPTARILAKKLAALEDAEDALIFSSGMAAISTAVISQLSAGDHIICVENSYGWTKTLLNDILKRFKVEISFVDGKSVENFNRAIQANTKIIYLESPNSLVFEVQDLEAIATLARKNKITTILDNSYAGPLSHSPIKMGIDIVAHSASKYINGHSDVVAGVICSSSKLIKDIFHCEYMTLGGAIGPFEAWLMIRSLRTLPMRIEQGSKTTQAIVTFLDKHPKIKKIYYPFHKDFPQKDLVKKHMPTPMAMFSVELASDNLIQIKLFCNSLKYFLMAASWGGHESLIFPTCVFTDSDDRNELPINIVRFYIGFEDSAVLINDLEQALKLL